MNAAQPGRKRDVFLTMSTGKIIRGNGEAVYLVLQPFPSELYSNRQVIEFCIPVRPVLLTSKNVIKIPRPFMLIHNLQNIFVHD